MEKLLQLLSIHDCFVLGLLKNFTIFSESKTSEHKFYFVHGSRRHRKFSSIFAMKIDLNSLPHTRCLKVPTDKIVELLSCCILTWFFGVDKRQPLYVKQMYVYRHWRITSYMFLFCRTVKKIIKYWLYVTREK